MRYAWAAYKQGALKDMGFEDDMSPEAFRIAFSDVVVNHCDAAWTIFGNTKRGRMPLAFVLASWAPGEAFLMVLGIAFMPWASKRNIIEATVTFFNRVRGQFAFMGYATKDHKRLYEVCMHHGIMRRVGTSHNAIPGKACAVFETITKQQAN